MKYFNSKISLPSITTVRTSTLCTLDNACEWRVQTAAAAQADFQREETWLGVKAKPVGMNITRRPPQNARGGRGDIHANAIGKRAVFSCGWAKYEFSQRG